MSSGRLALTRLFRAASLTLARTMGEARLAVSALAACALLACGGPGADIAVSRAGQPILRGVVDDAHPQVMLLVNVARGFSCTGTVVRVGEGSADLLTAAHCATDVVQGGVGLAPLPADEFVVVPGTDPALSAIEFPVIGVSVEPTYDGSFAADVAVLRFFFGEQEAPSAIAPLGAGEDALQAADALLLVGYGQTERSDARTLRRSVARSIDVLDAELLVYTQEDARGACFGDSGGPVLVELGGEERVAGVISGSVDSNDDCSGGLGVAMRVSAYGSFIQAALAVPSSP